MCHFIQFLLEILLNLFIFFVTVLQYHKRIKHIKSVAKKYLLTSYYRQAILLDTKDKRQTQVLTLTTLNIARMEILEPPINNEE